MNFRGAGSGRRAASVVDLTPLIDVVFQLLIFFLLTSSYVSNQAPSMDVDLPEASAEAAAETVEGFTVAVDASGNIFMDDHGAEDAPVTLDELGVRLTRLANEKPQSVVLIRGDQAAAYGSVVQVMNLARVVNLRISVEYRASN